MKRTKKTRDSGAAVLSFDPYISYVELKLRFTIPPWHPTIAIQHLYSAILAYFEDNQPDAEEEINHLRHTITKLEDQDRRLFDVMIPEMEARGMKVPEDVRRYHESLGKPKK